MDAATCAKISWMISGSFSGDSDELIKIRRALAEAIFNTDGKGFPKPIDPPAKVLDSKEWNGCKNAALEVADSKQSSDDSRKNQIKFILLAPNGLEDKPDIKSPDLNIAWPVTSDVAYQAGPVFDGSNRKIHLLGYYNIDQAQAMSEPGFGSEGLYPVELRSSVPPRTSSPQAQDNRRNSPIARLFFGLAMVVGITSMAWIYDVTKLIRTNTNLIFSEITKERELDKEKIKIKSITISNENETSLKSKSDSIKKCPANNCSEAEIKSLKEEIKGLEEKKKSLEKARPCIEKINEQLNKDSPSLQNYKQCTDILFAGENVSESKNRIIKFFRDQSINDSRLSLFLPFVLSQMAILLLVISAGYAIKGRPLGAFINNRNRMSLSGVQQILWLILLFGGITILAIFNIALLADYARPELQFFPKADITLWSAVGLTAVISPIGGRLINNKKDWGDGNLDSVEVRQDANDVAGQLASNRIAKWTDIFTNEKQENSNTVDISRLQHLVITGLLLGGYFILLSEYVSNINATVIFYALAKEQAVFTDMPPIDQTFIALMLISHAGYLAFKALPPKTNS